MGISGTWKAQQLNPYSTALKQGTGINPIHSVPYGPGRGIASHETAETVPPEVLDDLQPEGYGYCDEDLSSSLYGYGVQTGTAGRPPVGTQDNRGDSDGFPSYGPRRGGLPGGAIIRALNRGAKITTTEKQTQRQGIFRRYKETGAVRDAVTSDPSQYEIQTSMVQRDKVRAGSQVPSGRRNEYDAPIRSRIPGQRVPVYQDGYRHAEMEPYGQDVIIRPFIYRTAGTADPALMQVNEMYVSEPMQRTPASDLYTGPTVTTYPDTGNYTDEDMLPYV